jgi:1-pyrroline-4-hydroxy-2-carboxylate deaminase
MPVAFLEKVRYDRKRTWLLRVSIQQHMKLGVQLAPTPDMLRTQLRAVFLKNAVQTLIIRLVQPGRGRFQETRLQKDPELKQFLNFSDGKLGYDRAPVRMDLHETFGFDLHQRLSNRDAADAELLGKSVLPQLKARREFSIEDPPPQVFGDRSGHRPVLKGFCDRSWRRSRFGGHRVVAHRELGIPSIAPQNWNVLTSNILYNLHYEMQGDLRERRKVAKNVGWEGVFPAVTTQFKSNFDLDIDATRQVMDDLIRDGVSGLIVCGTVGENTSLSRSEKVAVMEAAKDISRGRVPVIAGVAEFTTRFASDVAEEAERIGMDGIMVMPALVYSSKPHETAAHFRGVSKATDLPIMVYNNPPIYRNDVTPEILASLADCETIVCFKDSSGDTRRFTDVRNMVGDRFVIFAGLDDVIVESVMLGAAGWVSGMSNAFPREGETLFRLAKAGRYEEAMPLYEWFMPLLHLDARSDLVQCIKLCESIMKRGSDLTRPPRLPLDATERAFVEKVMDEALKTRPVLPDVGLKSAA